MTWLQRAGLATRGDGSGWFVFVCVFCVSAQIGYSLFFLCKWRAIHLEIHYLFVKTNTQVTNIKFVFVDIKTHVQTSGSAV